MVFSVIVPVYKVEKYLGQTIDSVLSQSFTDFELLLVDDGSPDGCPALCDGASARDGRVRVLHKQNGGVSSARNAGIQAALGDYLLFLDGDDRLPPDAMSSIIKALDGSSQPDIIVACYMEFYEQSQTYRQCGYSLKDFSDWDSQQVLYYLFGECAGFHWAIWKQAYRREFILEHNLLFDSTLWINEDGNWLLEAFTNARQFTGINDIIYYYLADNAASVVHRGPSLNKYTSSYTVYVRWFGYFNKIYPQGKARDCMMASMARGYINCAKGLWRLKGQERSKAIAMFNAHLEIPPYSKVSAHKLLLPFRKCFGTVAFLWMVGQSHELKQRMKGLLTKRRR